jgi:DNA repair and recombination protein RAD54B
MALTSPAEQNPYYGSSSVVDRVLVVCPVTLVKVRGRVEKLRCIDTMQNWAREFKKWLGTDRIGVFAAESKTDVKMFCANKNNQVLIIGYEKVRGPSASDRCS